MASGDNAVITTTAGNPVANDSSSLTAGERGPILLQDYQLLEKLAHLNRERIAERVVHAKGWGAHGTFTVTNQDIFEKFSKADVFRPGHSFPLLARFSTVAGELGAADAERDVRGFAVKIYTNQGNWDIVGNNTPVFFIRDPRKFPDFVHSQKRHPLTHLRSTDAIWDFWSLHPESIHQITILMSDRGIPTSLCHMNGYGSHAFSLINRENKRFWVKFHFKTNQGHRFLTNRQSEEVIGKSRESYQIDLLSAINKGVFPKWRLCLQIMPEEDAESTPYNPFDVTKVWPHGDYPLIEAGIMELNRNPENYFTEIEQAAFSPSNIIPGIGFSPDKLLQGRIFAYADAHRHRLGTHYESLPVNAAKCPIYHYHADGQMRFFENKSGDVDAYYHPNSMDGARDDPSFAEPPLKISGSADRYEQKDTYGDYVQAHNLFQNFDNGQKSRLFKNIAESINDVRDDIFKRQMEIFHKVDPSYAKGVQDAVDELA